MSDRNAQIVVTMRNQAGPEVRGLASNLRDLIGETKEAQTNFDRLEKQFAALQQSAIRAAAATGEYDRALQLIDSELAAAGQGTIRYNQLLVQQAQIQQRAARAATLAAADQRQEIDALRATLTPAADASQQLSQGTAALGQGLTQLVGPAVAVTTVLTGLRAVVGATEEGFRLRATLDQEQGAIAIQLRGLRDTGATFQAADAFAKRYRLTQQEVTQAVADSVPVLRQSRSSVQDVLGVFSRLTILKPDKTFNDAARALGELQSGQATSLNKLFNVPLHDANAMKHEIEGGADAVQVLAHYLDSVGIGMEALDQRTKGATGKMHDLEQETENLKLALGDNASGLGLVILDERIRLTRGTTNALKGDYTDLAQTADQAADKNTLLGQAMGLVSIGLAAISVDALKNTDATRQNAQATQLLGLTQEQVARNTELLAGTQAHLRDEHLQTGQIVQQTSAQVQAFNASLQQNAAQTQISAAQSTILKQRQEDIAHSALLASQGLLGEGDQALLLAQRLGIARDQAQLLINANQVIAGQAAFAAQRAEEQGRLPDDELRSRNRARDAADKLHQQFVNDEAQKQKQIADAQRALDLARAHTPAQRIAIYQRELAATTDVAERLRIQAQIQQEKNSAAKAHTGELDKQLDLNERIRDSMESQLKASLDARKATIHDRQERRKEDQQIAAAQRILNDPSKSQFAAAARDRLDLIDVQRQQRALDIQQKLATAGGSIVNGRVLQSRPGSGALPSLPSAPGAPGALPSLPSAPGAPGALPSLPTLPALGGGGGGVPIINVQVLLDSTPIAARVITTLREGRAQNNAAGGGQ